MTYNVQWTYEEDTIMVREININKSLSDEVIGINLKAAHPQLYTHRSPDGMTQHVRHLRNGGKVSNIRKTW